jgi:leucyl-tRNA synthetase
MGRNVKEIEARWQARWEADGLFEIDVDAAGPGEKFYNLVEFPYPSAEGLHVGHAYTYCGADVYGRYQRMRGRRVFQPMGFDSFGIHTENFALRVGEHPKALTARTVENYRGQLRRLGAGWAWRHEIVTSEPSYYRWTQWIFLQLYRAGLAERREAPVVWCPSCKTVLAYEQLEGDRCERCGSEVTERVMQQWFLKITAYADELLAGLDELDWPELSKRLQREWIGRSEGVEVDFVVPQPGVTLSAFTTRVDTLFGVTFLAVTPEHPELDRLTTAERREEVERVVERSRAVAARHRTSNVDGVVAEAGAFTGSWAVHPATGELVPVYVAGYVVASYGTGAVIGVAAHDRRDHDFAERMGLPVRRVIEAETSDTELPWTGEGTLVGSGEFTGVDSPSARAAIAGWLEREGKGRRLVRYRLRDWLISRQRYWGPPIPIVYCDGCGTVPVSEDDLPVLLPEVEDVRPTGTASSPLAAVESFVRTTCPRCGGPARRETDVSDTFLDSAWYFLRYPSAADDRRAWDPGRTARMLPVDLYAGGVEHVVRHHLYARFVTRALHDLELVPFAEPFPKIRLHGLLVKDGAKMSKSRGNVVDPDEYVERVGADNLRMYLLFCGDWQEGGDFRDDGLAGVERFTARVWRFVTDPHEPGPGGVDLRELDRAIARVGADIERLKFNTAISALMELMGWAGRSKARMASNERRRTAETLVLLVAPFAPHLAEELWSRLGGEYSVHRHPWPLFDPSALGGKEFTLVVQVDGRVRDRRTAPSGIGREEALALALESKNVRKYVDEFAPAAVVFVPGRLINLLTSSKMEREQREAPFGSSSP